MCSKFLPSVPANWALVDFAPCQFLMTHGAENVSIFALIDCWNQDCITTYQEPAIPGFSVSITILIPKKGLDDFDTDFETQGCAKFDSDSDTDTKTLEEV